MQVQRYVRTEKWLQPPIQGKTFSNQNSTSQEQMCKPPQEQILEALHSLLEKQAVETVKVQSSLAFNNRLFLVPKLTDKWCPILDLGSLNKFLKVQTFKMETPESKRLSLQTGEWVSSQDFSDAYFHIHISHSSQKYLRFHCQNQTFHFTALPFVFSTAPMEFTIVIKEVKLVVQSCQIWIHQYLDD